MIKKAYKEGFIEVCRKYGLQDGISDTLYKTAQSAGSLEQIWRGIRGLGAPVADIFRGVGGGLSAGFRRIDRAAEILRQPWHLNRRIAESFGGRLGRVPGLRSFGRGFARAQRDFERNPTLLKSLAAMTGLGKGSLIGNTLAGLGSFTSAHPILGTALFTLPAATLAARVTRDDNAKGLIDTMTPSERRAFNRIFNNSGYSGIRDTEADIDLFGAL